MSVLSDYIKKRVNLGIGEYEFLESTQRYEAGYWIFSDYVYLFRIGEETWEHVTSFWDKYITDLPEELSYDEKNNLIFEQLDAIAERVLSKDMITEKVKIKYTNIDHIQASKSVEKLRDDARYDAAMGSKVKLRRVLTTGKVMNRFLSDKPEPTSKPSL